MKTQNVTVYIVDDDEFFRKSLRRLVQAMGYRVVDFHSAVAFLELSVIKRPSCLILDFNLPKMDGLTLQGELLAKGIHIPIIFISGYGSIPISVRAMKKGAIDFLQKPFSAQEMGEVISSAIALDSQNSKKDKAAQEAQFLFDALTPREQEVFRWVIAGKLSKQIAAQLGAAEKTIRVHRGRVMKKMRVHSVAELVRAAQIINITPVFK